MAADLDIALLENVQQPYLDTFRQVRQLVNGKDAAISMGNQTEVQGFLVGEVAALGDFDWVDFANQISDGNVGCRELSP